MFKIISAVWLSSWEQRSHGAIGLQVAWTARWWGGSYVYRGGSIPMVLNIGCHSSLKNVLLCPVFFGIVWRCQHRNPLMCLPEPCLGCVPNTRSPENFLQCRGKKSTALDRVAGIRLGSTRLPGMQLFPSLASFCCTTVNCSWPLQSPAFVGKVCRSCCIDHYVKLVLIVCRKFMCSYNNGVFSY